MKTYRSSQSVSRVERALLKIASRVGGELRNNEQGVPRLVVGDYWEVRYSLKTRRFSVLDSYGEAVRFEKHFQDGWNDVANWIREERERLTGEIVVLCPYCEGDAKLVDATEIYGERAEREDWGKFWLCRPCNAYVGTHRKSPNHQPLGTLADAVTRKWRNRAHAAFDPLWKRKSKRCKFSGPRSRSLAYAWLAKQMDLDEADCHIAMFDVVQCRKVVEVCS